MCHVSLKLCSSVVLCCTSKRRLPLLILYCICVSLMLSSPRFAITASISLLDLSSLPHQFATGPRPTHHQVIYPCCTPLLLPLLHHHHHQSSLLGPVGNGLFVGRLLFLRRKIVSDLKAFKNLGNS